MEGDAGGAVNGEVVSAGADGWEGDGFEVVLMGKTEAVVIGLAQQVILAAIAAVPDGSDGVDDVLGLEISGGSDDSLAGGATALSGNDLSALFEDFGAAGTVDGAIDTASAHERAVGGVDNGIGILLGDITLDKCDIRVHGRAR